MGAPGRVFSVFMGLLVTLLCVFSQADEQQQQSDGYRNLFDPQVSLTINPRTGNLQIYWSNLKVERGDRILITDVDPQVDKFRQHGVQEDVPTSTQSPSTTTESDFITRLYSLDKYLGLTPDSSEQTQDTSSTTDSSVTTWTFGEPPRDVLYSMMIQESSGWWKTNIPFNKLLFNQVTVNSSCYGYWAHMIDANGTVLTRSCWSAHPRWMNEMRDTIKDVKIRNLFIPGTHDSGSYKQSYRENLLTKYAVTQEDDIRSQLMHGIRYLDLRVGHYRKYQHPFYIVHSVVKFQPLIEVLEAVKNFVDETNEIVIIDFQEFPVGFHPNATEIHQKLVQYIYDIMKNHLVAPFGTWDVSLDDVWKKKGNVIIGYDKPGIQYEYRDMLWQSVEHFWPNKGDLKSLVQYLKWTRNANAMNYRMRPIAEMAELTAQTIDVLTDRYGGLRKMAQSTNREVSELYSSEFGLEANVVAVDFYQSSTIVDSALKFNRMKRQTLE